MISRAFRIFSVPVVISFSCFSGEVKLNTVDAKATIQRVLTAWRIEYQPITLTKFGPVPAMGANKTVSVPISAIFDLHSHKETFDATATFTYSQDGKWYLTAVEFLRNFGNPKANVEVIKSDPKIACGISRTSQVVGKWVDTPANENSEWEFFSGHTSLWQSSPKGKWARKGKWVILNDGRLKIDLQDDVLHRDITIMGRLEAGSLVLDSIDNEATYHGVCRKK